MEVVVQLKCTRCGHGYRSNKPPSHDHTCKSCGGKLEVVPSRQEDPHNAPTLTDQSEDSPSEVVTASQEHSKIFGKYTLVEKLGQGGMGVVYKAYDARLQRYSAIKIITPSTDSESSREEQVARFMREAQMAAKLNHPNIVQVHELGEVNGTHFIDMEFVPGKTLSHYFKKSLPPKHYSGSAAIEKEYIRKNLVLMVDAIRAIHYAHSQGIIHRDIKPENIFVTQIGEKEVAKVGDFGLAKPIVGDTRLTISGIVVGTPAYMSPEQATGDPLGPQSDIFSLGGVLYEMLTRRHPFRGKGVVEILKAVTDHEPPSPRKIN